jgi:hypothetical protein
VSAILGEAVRCDAGQKPVEEAEPRREIRTLSSPTMAPVQSPLKTVLSALCFDFRSPASTFMPLLSRPSITMDIPLQTVRGSVFLDVSSFVAGRDSPPPREVAHSAPSSVPLLMGLTTYDSSIASAFSVRHPNFDSSSMDDSNFIRGGFLSRGLHVYTPEPGVFYQNIDVRHHRIFPSYLIYEQLTRMGYLVARPKQQNDIRDAPIFGFALPTDCPAAVKCGDLVHVFTEDDMAGGIIDRQVSSTDDAAVFLFHGYWYPRTSPFHVSGWFHIRTSARFAPVLGHATDSQRDHWFITNKAEDKPLDSFQGFYCELKLLVKYHLIYPLRQHGSTPRCASPTRRATTRSGVWGSRHDQTCGLCFMNRIYTV